MKIKPRKIIAVGIISIIMSGCPVLTKNPIGNPVSSEILYNFIGEWEIINDEKIEDTVVISVNSVENGEIFITSIKNLKTEKFLLTKGEKYSFFQMRDSKLYGDAYYWGIFQRKSDSIIFSNPDPDKFEKATKSKTIKAKVISKERDGSNSQVVINDKMQNIENFISKHKNSELFPTSMIFRQLHINSSPNASANISCIIRLQNAIKNGTYNKIRINPGVKILVQYDDTTVTRGGRMNCLYDTETLSVDSIWSEK